jgi:SAM-dependent methyltransferase
MIQRLFFELSYLSRKTPWDSGVSPPELLEFIGSATAGRALDVGCGTGTNVITLAQYGWQATGMDISTLAICRARRKAKDAGVRAHFLKGDASDLWRVDGHFDFVLDIGCFHSLPPLGRTCYIQNLLRVLQVGGIYLLYTWIALEKGTNLHLPSEDIIHVLFQDGFETAEFKIGHDTAGQRPSAWIKMRRLI